MDESSDIESILTIGQSMIEKWNMDHGLALGSIELPERQAMVSIDEFLCNVCGDFISSYGCDTHN